MCMACEEMQLFYAYLDAVEEAKRKAQPWQCEVTVIPQGDEAATAAPKAAAKPVPQSALAAGGFACDDVSDAIADQTPPPLGKP
jgi:hypothetical protein